MRELGERAGDGDGVMDGETRAVSVRLGWDEMGKDVYLDSRKKSIFVLLMGRTGMR